VAPAGSKPGWADRGQDRLPIPAPGDQADGTDKSLRRLTVLTLTTAETGPAIHVDGCVHHPPCAYATAPDHNAAKVVHDYRIGFSLLCNGVEVFDDTGEIRPDGTTVGPHQPEPLHRKAA
jgi:Family of unknown function (DUF5999)